jgi:hypothetical protein
VGIPRRACTSRTSAQRARDAPGVRGGRADPDSWDCPRCGLPANTDEENPPPPPKITPYKTHLAYVKERRTDAEAEAILAEALDSLRSRRAAGEVIY